MDPEEFLTDLWGNPPPGVALVWTLPNNRSRWYTRFDEVTQEMKDHALEDIYTGVGIANRNGNRFTSQNRLTEEEVGGLAGMWADIDWNHPVHRKTNLPPTQEQVLATLEEALLEPTLLVDSGHGIQAWWLFEQPWLFQSAQEHELGRRAAQWWHQHIKALYTARGWTTDSVFNLDRIMRLPGTWNNREPVDRKPVIAIGQKGKRYTPEEFLDRVPGEFQTSAPPLGRRGGRKPPRRGAVSGGPGQLLTLSSDAEPSAVRLAAILKGNPKFRRSWEQDRKDMNDQSASAYDMSMATIALGAGWPDQEVVNLLICWRRKHGHDLKLRENYYALTLDKAREPMELIHAQEQLNETLLQPPEDQTRGADGQPGHALRRGHHPDREVPGRPANLLHVHRTGKHHAGEDRERHLPGEVPGLAAAAATGVMIPSVGKKIWEQRVQAMLLACEEIEVGDASHPAQETRLWLAEYLLEKPPREDEEWEKAAEAKQPFLRHGRVHIFMDDLRRWLELAVGDKMTSHALGRRLRLCMAHPEQVNIRIGNTRTTRTCWMLSEEDAPPQDGAGKTPEEQP